MSWKMSALASREEVEGALETRDASPDWDEAIVLTGFEIDLKRPDRWQLDAYTPDKPTPAQRKAVRDLLPGNTARLVTEELPDADWVTESQRGAEPIRAGRFHVHTPDHPPLCLPGIVDFCIPAAQAFGTGHHETTAGCLAMLDRMRREGVQPRHVADIGTGTGLLAFAALALWPRAIATATDIDPVCEPAVLDNAALNAIRIGDGPGELTMLVADGMDDPAIEAAAPFDLLVANILAAPLIDMAWDFAEAVTPRGSILLSGLLEKQERDVRRAYARAGFRLHRRLVSGDWSILWLRHRYRG